MWKLFTILLKVNCCKKKEKNMKRILVACGNGIATSTVVATKIREKCEESGIAVSVTQCKLLEVESKADDYDLLVTTGKFTGGDVKIPVVGAISLLTGIGEEATLDEIISHLK
jgi:PTS system galactitol-specific IIB component